MKTKLVRQIAVPLSLLATHALCGQSVAPESAAAAAAATPLRHEHTAEPSHNRFQLSYRAAFNISANFKNIGAFPARSNPNPMDNPAHPGFFLRTYDDGFLGEDVTHDQHGDYQGSWYWGYQHASQVQGDTLVMHSSSSSGTSSCDQGDSLQHGLELTCNREFLRHKKWSGGLEGAFNFTPVSIKDSSPQAAVFNRRSDAYQLNGVIPPQTLPYNGLFGSAGAVIGDVPTRTTDQVTGPVNGSRNFSANLFGFRIGPYLEFALSKKVSLDLNAGLAVVIAQSDYTYRELVNTPDAGTVAINGSSSSCGVLVGGYVGSQISVALAKDWNAVVGAQFQDVGTYSHRADAAGRAAVLDLSKTVFVSIGLTYSF